MSSIQDNRQNNIIPFPHKRFAYGPFVMIPETGTVVDHIGGILTSVFIEDTKTSRCPVTRRAGQVFSALMEQHGFPYEGWINE